MLASRASQRPGVENERVLLAVEQDQIEHIERVDRLDAFDQRAFAVAVQGLQCEAARIDLATFGDELGDLVVEVHRRRRSEEHTSELQSLRHLVCRLLLEKKKK